MAVSRSATPLAQLADRQDQLLELAVALGDLLVPGLVREELRVGQARLDVLVLALQLTQSVQHQIGRLPVRSVAPVAGEGDELGGTEQSLGEQLR